MYNLVHFWLFLIQFFSHVLTGPTEVKAANTNLTNARWMDPASWSGGASPFSGLFGSPVPGILNLSDYVDPPSVQQTTGQRSTPSAVAGSAEQLEGAGHQHAHSVSDEVTEHEREEREPT